MSSFHFFILFIFLGTKLFSEIINTFYGPIEVEEEVLIELIHSPPFQRLKSIHQYGVAYYIATHPEEYNRFDHSLGVFAILRTKGASLEEQIAGLLHDISHTVFSHVGDWVFPEKHEKEDDYQSTIHNIYLAVSGVEEILNKYGYTIEHVSPRRKEFGMLEQSLPNLCADRIDYNIQGAYFQNFITLEEAQKLFHDLSFEEGKWVVTDEELAAKLAHSSLFMTENCWGSPVNFMASQWLADAIVQGFKTGLISLYEFHFGTDKEIWDRLSSAEDPLIRKKMKMVMCPDKYCQLVDPEQANAFIKFKCRGIDPWIRREGRVVRLTSIDSSLEKAFKRVKGYSMEGWPVEIGLYTEESDLYSNAHLPKSK